MVLAHNFYALRLLPAGNDAADDYWYFYVHTPEPDRLSDFHSVQGVSLRRADDSFKFYCFVSIPFISSFDEMRPVHAFLESDAAQANSRDEMDEDGEVWVTLRNGIPQHLHQIVLNCLREYATPVQHDVITID